MIPNEPHADFVTPKRPLDPFRRAVLRGLAILMPPLLTIVIFLWVGNTVNNYLLEPLEGRVRWLLAERLADIRNANVVPKEQIVDGVVTIDGEQYQLTSDRKSLIPAEVYVYVADPQRLGKGPEPHNAEGLYTRYVNQRWTPRK